MKTERPEIADVKASLPKGVEQSSETLYLLHPFERGHGDKEDPLVVRNRKSLDHASLAAGMLAVKAEDPVYIALEDQQVSVDKYGYVTPKDTQSESLRAQVDEGLQSLRTRASGFFAQK